MSRNVVKGNRFFQPDIISSYIMFSFLIGLMLGFSTGLLVLVLFSFVMSLKYYNRPKMLIFMLIMVSVDPVMRTYLMEGVFFRYNTFNYLLLSLVLVNSIYRAKLDIKPIRFYLLLLVWMLAGLIMSKDIVLGGLSIIGYIAFLAFYIFLRYSADHPDFGEILEKGLKYGVISALLFSILFFLSFGFEVFKQDLFDKTGGNYINPNSFTYMPLAGIVFSTLLVKFFNHSIRQQIAVQILLLAMIGIAGSRGSFLVASLSIFFSISGTVRISRLIFVGLLAYTILLASSDLLRNSGIYSIERLSTFFNEDNDLSKASSGRSEIAFVGFQMFKSSPIIGIGTGSFRETFAELTLDYQNYDSDFLYRRRGDRIAAHSAYIKVMAENGLIGLILLTCQLLSFYLARIKDNLQVIAFSILLISFLSTEFNAKVPWFICAIMIVMYHKNISFKGS